MLAISASLPTVNVTAHRQTVISDIKPEKIESLKEKLQGFDCGTYCTTDMVEENNNWNFDEAIFNISGYHHLMKRSPKVLSMYAAAWSKKLKATGLIYPPPFSWYFKAYSLFDAGLAKALFKVPIVGRKKRSPKVLSAYAATWWKLWKAYALLAKPASKPAAKFFKFMGTVDLTLAKALLKVPIVGRKKRSQP